MIRLPPPGPGLTLLTLLALTGPVLAQTPAAQTPAAQTPAAQVPPAPPPIPLELNKLEPLTQGGPGCRVYFLTSNPDARPIEQLRLDLILFGGDGVIARRVAFDLGPLPARKTAVRLFDMPGLPCDDIAKILVNDVLVCRTGEDPASTGEQDHSACLDRLAVSARGKVPLAK